MLPPKKKVDFVAFSLLEARLGSVRGQYFPPYVVRHFLQHRLRQCAAFYKLFKDPLKPSQRFLLPLVGSFLPSHGWECYSESACGEGVLIFSCAKPLPEVLCTEVRGCGTWTAEKQGSFMSCSLWEQSELPFRAAFYTRMKPFRLPCMVLHEVCLSEERWISENHVWVEGGTAEPN